MLFVQPIKIFTYGSWECISNYIGTHFDLAQLLLTQSLYILSMFFESDYTEMDISQLSAL